MNITRYRNALIAAGIAALLGVGVSACGKSPDYAARQEASGSAGAAAQDTSITTQVEARLAADRTLGSSEISVTTTDGVVILQGSVRDADAKSAAETAAQSVAGVTRVDNRLSIDSRDLTVASAQQAMSDTWITTKVKAELLADRDAKGLKINVDTKDGVVTLEGTVADQDAIEHIKDIAAGVEGVKRVETSGLTVEPSS